MKHWFLYIWYKITGQPKILVQDIRLKNPKKEWISRGEYGAWARQTNGIYEEELEVQKKPGCRVCLVPGRKHCR